MAISETHSQPWKSVLILPGKKCSEFSTEFLGGALIYVKRFGHLEISASFVIRISSFDIQLLPH